MSEENIEIVRGCFPGAVDLVSVFDNPDLFDALREGIEPFVAPDFETIGDPNAIPMGPMIGVEGGPPDLFAKGLDGFVDFWRDWITAWESWSLGPPGFIDVDENRVMVIQEVRARSKTDQVELVIDAANLVTLREEKVTRVELYFNREKALEVAGLVD